MVSIGNPFTGAICFSINPTNVFSNLIAWATSSQYSHTFVVAGNCALGSTQIPMVIEAGQHDVALVPFSHYKNGSIGYAVFLPITTPGVVNAALNRLAPLLGKDYSYSTAAWIGVKSLGDAIGLKVEVPRSSDYVCSQLVLEYLRGLGPTFLPASLGLDATAVTPREIWDKVVANPKLFRRVEYHKPQGELI